MSGAAEHDSAYWAVPSPAFTRLPPQEQVQHADCPSNHWWQLAVNHPIEAIASPLFPLLTLENPAQWVLWESRHMGRWIDSEAPRLSPKRQYLWQADMAEHVLPFFEKMAPNDDRPRKAIEMRRLYAKKKKKEKRWKAAQAEALEAGQEMARKAHYRIQLTRKRMPLFFTDNGVKSIFAAREAAYAAAYSFVWDVHLHAAQSAGKDASGKIEAEAHPEEKWQWERLQVYLRGEHKK